MEYLFTIAGPVLIIVLNYWATKVKPINISDYVNILIRALPDEFGYMFFLYYLDTEKIVDAGWAPITLVTFLIPISIILLLLKIFFWLKLKKSINPA